jgi:hypothetical protein
MGMLGLCGGIISKYVCIPKYLVVYPEHIQFLFINYTIVKLRKKERDYISKRDSYTIRDWELYLSLSQLKAKYRTWQM